MKIVWSSQKKWNLAYSLAFEISESSLWPLRPEVKAQKVLCRPTQEQGHSSNTNKEERRRGAGRIPTHKKFPTLAEVVRAYCKQGSNHAQLRRRSETMTLGSRLKDIQAHVYKEIPELQHHGISLNTVHRLFLPPSHQWICIKGYCRSTNCNGTAMDCNVDFLPVVLIAYNVFF